MPLSGPQRFGIAPSILTYYHQSNYFKSVSKYLNKGALIFLQVTKRMLIPPSPHSISMNVFCLIGFFIFSLEYFGVHMCLAVYRVVSHTMTLGHCCMYVTNYFISLCVLIREKKDDALTLLLFVLCITYLTLLCMYLYLYHKPTL